MLGVFLTAHLNRWAKERAKPVLLREIQTFLRRSGMAESRFGMLAMCDPSFVASLRKGRQPGPTTLERCRAFIRAASETAEHPNGVLITPHPARSQRLRLK